MEFFLNFLLVLVISAVTAAVSISGGLLMLQKNKLADRLQQAGPFVAVVAILYAVFGDLVPEVQESGRLTGPQLLGLLLAGFAACAVFGFILGLFHHHSDVHAETKGKIHGNDKKLKSRAQAYSMVIVDSIHTAADGIMLGSACAAGPAAGLGAALSIAAHEFPQEIGDFSIMLESNMRKKRIIFLELGSALVLVPAALLTFSLGNIFRDQLPYLLAFSAGFLLYIGFGEIVCIAGRIRTRLPKQLKLKKG